jgi:hypothetical protein
MSLITRTILGILTTLAASYAVQIWLQSSGLALLR